MKPILSIVLLALLTSCSSEEAPQATDPETIPPPPSIQEQVSSVRMVRLTDRQVAELNVETTPVKLGAASFRIRIPGEVHPSPEHFAEVSAPISGRVVTIHAHEGERVSKGDVLLEMESLGFANLVAEYLEAAADLTYAQAEQNRVELLVERGITPVRELERARSELIRAETKQSATYARLRAVGVTDDVMASWSSTARQRPLLRIIAPLDGIIDQHGIDTGKAVDENQSMLTIVDPGHVLVQGFASPEDAGLFSLGDAVFITSRQQSTLQVEAFINTINPSVDEVNRSVVMNILADTQNGWPRPGESVQVLVAAESATDVISIPLDAVQYDGETAMVFVARDEKTFEMRPVRLLRINENSAFISAGLEAGEAVALSQVFTLKALSRFDLFGEE